MGRQLRFRGGAESPSESDSRNVAAHTSDYHFDLFSFLRILFRHRRWLAAAVLGAGILAAVITLLIPNKYTATARLLPSGGSGKLSALAGITGLPMLDIAGGLGLSENSSELFPAILKSDLMKNIALNHVYSFTDDGHQFQMNLLEYFNEYNLDRARTELDAITSVSTEFKTGIITLSVITKYPELSAAVAQLYIDELDLFNRTRRKTRATEYEKFVSQRLVETQSELAESEIKLSRFQGINRDWALSSDPELQMELLKLKRDLVIKGKTFGFITQQYELARSETQKNLPVVQALDEPAVPLVKSSPRRTMMVLFAMFVAGIFGVGIIFIRESLVGGARGVDRESFRNLRSDLSVAYPRLSKRFESPGDQAANQRYDVREFS